MRLILFTVILSFAVGCSSAGVRSSAEYSHGVLSAHFEENRMCAASWQNIVDDWIESGGSLTEDIEANRAMIAGDKVSVFASLIREVWRRQVAAGTDVDRSFAFNEVLESRNVVPDSCTPLFWVQGVLAGTPTAFSAGAMTTLQKRLGIDDDRLRATDWIMSQLLISPTNARN